MTLRLIPWGLAALSLVAAGVLLWRLNAAHERIGELDMAAKTYAKALADKQQATQSRAVTQQKVRQMAPAEKLERLR